MIIYESCTPITRLRTAKKNAHETRVCTPRPVGIRKLLRNARKRFTVHAVVAREICRHRWLRAFCVRSSGDHNNRRIFHYVGPVAFPVRNSSTPKRFGRNCRRRRATSNAPIRFSSAAFVFVVVRNAPDNGESPCTRPYTNTERSQSKVRATDIFGEREEPRDDFVLNRRP